MEILWWLAPPVAVTLLAMARVSWVSREGYGVVDPEVAAQRLGKALAKDHSPRRTPKTSPRQQRVPSTGVASRGFRDGSSLASSTTGADGSSLASSIGEDVPRTGE